MSFNWLKLTVGLCKPSALYLPSLWWLKTPFASFAWENVPDLWQIPGYFYGCERGLRIFMQFFFYLAICAILIHKPFSHCMLICWRANLLFKYFVNLDYSSNLIFKHMSFLMDEGDKVLSGIVLFSVKGHVILNSCLTNNAAMLAIFCTALIVHVIRNWQQVHFHLFFARVIPHSISLRSIQDFPS